MDLVNGTQKFASLDFREVLKNLTYDMYLIFKKLNLYEFGNSTRTLWVHPTTSVFINAGAVYMQQVVRSHRRQICHSTKVVVERVAKSWVSNRSDSKKSDSGQLGWEFQKVGFGYPKSQVFCQVSCTFYSKFYVLFHKVGFG